MPLNLKRLARFAPRPPRKAVCLEAYALLPDDREVVVRLTNISPRGFTAVSDTVFVPAIRFGLSVPGFGIKRAEVCWVSATEFGGRFDTCLPVPFVDSL